MKVKESESEWNSSKTINNKNWWDWPLKVPEAEPLSQNWLSHISFRVAHKNPVMMLMCGSSVKMPGIPSHLPLPTSLLQGIPWATCEDCKCDYIIFFSAFWTVCLPLRIKRSSNPGKKNETFFIEHPESARTIQSHWILAATLLLGMASPFYQLGNRVQKNQHLFHIVRFQSWIYISFSSPPSSHCII